jgi:hypothetical protein
MITKDSSQCGEQKLRDFAPTTLGALVCIREYSNQAKFNTFLLNHFNWTDFRQMI